MNKYGKRGEVWISELNGKRRPVVIVSNDVVIVELDHLIATVTSKRARNQFDVVVEFWKEAGLEKPSIVRCSKLNTLHYRELLFKIGKLQESDLKKVLSTIREYF
ncbi:type II toxin-antitoxin system PemK/MazF family toxin [Radiobacillus kanasensis]|uniref:type II toxin-antitoxin system PemK/MazF family toxin n=1 Tax=Radiobacillus kanasensis TaxID=2844358 RepID=UPI001E58727F|nr:type II toxin-antitoxin system PemK/MazF family toxin [Radiobacillus kanasensis]UFU00254.1 type II toxin-antitoxin system PemK/MazF family toxin [Radiobacillus kanasensis]